MSMCGCVVMVYVKLNIIRGLYTSMLVFLQLRKHDSRESPGFPLIIPAISKLQCSVCATEGSCAAVDVLLATATAIYTLCTLVARIMSSTLSSNLHP